MKNSIFDEHASKFAALLGACCQIGQLRMQCILMLCFKTHLMLGPMSLSMGERKCVITPTIVLRLLINIVSSEEDMNSYLQITDKVVRINNSKYRLSYLPFKRQFRPFLNISNINTWAINPH